MREYNNHNGFTLIELAIVLVIIGMLVGLGANMIGPLTNFVKVRETRDMMDANLQSIISWASSRNTIPNTSSNLDGFKSVAKSPNDAWGRAMAFMYYSSLRVNVTKDSICGRRSTNLTLVTTDPAATVSNVAFALLSAADNTAFKSTLGAVAITASAAASGTINVTGPNSDLVRWITLDELRSKIGCQGAPLKIVNNELPYGYNKIAYSAKIYADGGVAFADGNGTYRWCIQNNTGIVPANMTFKNSGGTDIRFSTDCQQGVLEANWTQADSIIISGTPIISVTGTDGLIYTSKQSHIAAAANRPITGTPGVWDANWQGSGTTTTTSVWTLDLSYPSSSNTLTVFVRDNNDSSGTNDNIGSKPFVFTINPQ